MTRPEAPTRSAMARVKNPGPEPKSSPVMPGLRKGAKIRREG